MAAGTHGGRDVVTPSAIETRSPTSRERLVSAAIDLIREHHREPVAARDVFAYLHPRSVAERAGVSRGLIYPHWGDPSEDGVDAFDRFLSEVTDELWTLVTVPDDLADLADLLPDELGEVVSTLANYELERFLGDDGTGRSILALSLYAIGSSADTPVSVAHMAKLYERILPKLGRELRPPLSYDDVAFSLMALLDGFVLHLPAMSHVITRRHQWSSAPEAEGDDGWTLFAIAVEAIVLHMTRPLPAATVDRDDSASGRTQDEDPV